MTIYEEIEETVRGIARVLMAETGQSMAEVWDEALSLYRVQNASHAGVWIQPWVRILA